MSRLDAKRYRKAKTHDAADVFQGIQAFAKELLASGPLPLLSNNGKWKVLGKRIPKAYKFLDEESCRGLLAGLESLHVNKDKTPIVAWAAEILNRSGGRLFDGYSQGRQDGN